MYIDGELHHGFGQQLATTAETGIVTRSLSILCEAESEEIRNSFGMDPEGTHRVQLVAQVDGFELLYSDEIEYTAQCDDPAVRARDVRSSRFEPIPWARGS